MNEYTDYDIILEYTHGQTILNIINANRILKALEHALEDSLLYKDLKYIASIEVCTQSSTKIIIN